MSTTDESVRPTSLSEADAETEIGVSDATTPDLTPAQVFSVEQLSQLNERSNWKGGLQLAGHLLVMVLSGTVWLTHRSEVWTQPALVFPALILYGFSLASMFATLHECVHRSVFTSNSLNDGVAWFAGLLSFYNSTFYRRYHKWHHRYTQIPGKDPELSDPAPTDLGSYLWQVSGIPWWIGKVRGHWRAATGQLEDCPFISETVRPEVQRSVQLQLGVYALAIAASFYSQSAWFVWAWLLPLAVGQPFLRLILFAEHTGCSLDHNPVTNTRTTLTLAPIRFLMWNMPFHAEHHFCPSMPFHALPTAHQQLQPYLKQIGTGYLAVNASIIRGLQPKTP